jgi:hypothetical protein
MAKTKNRIGERIGRLTIIAFDGIRNKNAHWKCKCDCGEMLISCGCNLKKGHTISCGCYRKEMAKTSRPIHGHCLRYSRTRTYYSWSGAKERCSRKKSKQFKNYGGRGIKMCRRWLNSFKNFLKDMGEKPIGKSIDRINNNGDYKPSNCRWATQKEQTNNTRKNHFLKFRGKKMSISQWAEEIGMKENTLYLRIHKGWSIESALTRPVR